MTSRAAALDTEARRHLEAERQRHLDLSRRPELDEAARAYHASEAERIERRLIGRPAVRML